MRAIAARYTDEDPILYHSAATRFRLLFWDPFLPRNHVDKEGPLYKGAYKDLWGLPRILGAETVWVRRPEGTKLEEMPNRLYRFKFPKKEIISAKGRKPFGFSRISKCPLPKSSAVVLNA